MHQSTNKYLITAIIIGLIFHGTCIFYTLENTYDALIHLFFGNHYANQWFDAWNYSWYTGFTVMGYPPLVHQCIALISLIVGLKFSLFIVAQIAILLFITGVYRYALVFTSDQKVAGYTALLAVFSSAFIETLHVFGQLPSIVGISVLMHALPEIYLWIKEGKYTYLIKALSLIAVTVTSHHVTPIFGMVFFIFPLIGMAIMDGAQEKVGSYKAVRLRGFIITFLLFLKRILAFGLCSLILIISCILPYWINTKNNPITQVPIPHGSRDNFLEVTSSGLVFFLIPWGVILLIMPYIWYRFYSKRYLFFGLSITLLTILGTGGTTPIPRRILGDNAFNILTLDRFTLWASLMALPIFGEFIFRLVEGDLKKQMKVMVGSVLFRILGAGLALCIIGITFFTVCLGYFRPLQPSKIKMLPIINFLKQDQHDHWRYLPLGFGDQMAWLSAQTNAMTVDGNYHSARRLPELTTRAVERLENSKFRGVEGIGSLQQFLTVPEKYHLKYVFSNDKFYDPILYFCGWQRLRQLENGIMVWEKLNVPPMPSILPKDTIPFFQKIMWGCIPIFTVIFALLLNLKSIWIHGLKTKISPTPVYFNFRASFFGVKRTLLYVSSLWLVGVILVAFYGVIQMYYKHANQISPQNVLHAYYDALDFKKFKKAYAFLNPKRNKSLDQFMLEVSVSDGLISSYAKLDGLHIDIIAQSDDIASAKVKGKWITPLNILNKSFYHEMVKQNGKWFIEPLEKDLDIPPDQLFVENVNTYYNHGRRRITTEQTYHEDILKQPELEVLAAKIVSKNDQHYLIGELQNIDNLPSDVVIKGILYSENDSELASYNVKDHMKHKLMPKEITSFKIDFEDIAWKNTKDIKPKTFDPKQFTSLNISEKPTKFNLHCVATSVTNDLYKGVGVNDLIINKNSIQGVLFNSGTQEVTIPQILITYYDSNKSIIWVEQKYLSEGIRPQRKRYFEFEFLNLKGLKCNNDQSKQIFVNGIPNKQIHQKMLKNRPLNYKNAGLMPVAGSGFSFIKIDINSYIGASKL